VVRDRGQAEQASLARAIVADLQHQAALTGPRRLVSVFLGGGTPSLMDPAWAADIIDAARRLWPADGPIEITLEANPTDAEAARFAAFADAGVDRLSLGLQSLDDSALRFLGRNHDAASARRAAETARRAFPRLSLDLIYALPGQTAEAWSRELDAVLDLGPEHLSPYQLTIEAGTAFDRAVKRGGFRPAHPEIAADLYELTQARLGAAGFEAYEVSNHARGEAARSRHNLVYWRGEDYAAAGPGAHARLTVGGVRRAGQAHARVRDYIDAVERTGSGAAQWEPLSGREAALERLLLGLRTVEGAPLGELADLPLNRRALDMLQEEQLVAVDGGRLTATARGRPLLDRVCAELAA
jgi:oxygen-independent coproporphyrinogen-3 oxidase